jgi:hypothetical protein
MMFLHNPDSFERQYGDVEWAPVSFPVAQDWFKYHNKLSYMYGDPPEIIFISMVSFRWSDSIWKGNIYIERWYIITTCFRWIILHIWQYNVTSTLL